MREEEGARCSDPVYTNLMKESWVYIYGFRSLNLSGFNHSVIAQLLSIDNSTFSELLLYVIFEIYAYISL